MGYENVDEPAPYGELARLKIEAGKKKPKKKPKPKKKTAKSKAKAGTVVRSERLDLRLTKAEKARIVAEAKKARRTVTSIVIEAIGKIR